MTNTTCADCGDKGNREVLHRGTGERHRVKCHCQYDLPIKLVLQPEPSGCGIAVVATVAGKTYQEVRQYIHLDRDFTQEGMYDSELESLLVQFGFTWQVLTMVNPRLSTRRDPWPPAPWAPLHVAKVTNLRESGLHYVVVLPDGMVLDPHCGVIQGLHRYPRVHQVYGLWPVSGFVPSPPTLADNA